MDFGILGHVEARRDGEAVPIGGPKVRALLAVLLLRPNEIVSRDRLIEGLWGERPPPSAAHTLDDNVSRLRKVVGATRIDRRAPGYAIRVEPGELDLERFEDLFKSGRESLAAGDPARAARLLGDALALWRGPALADVLYEPFAQGEAARLEERRLLAVEERIEAALALGHSAELVTELERLVRDHPLRERPIAQLMAALYGAGRQAEALALHARARQRLAEELGLEPGPLLQAAQRKILFQDTGLVTPADMPSAAAPRRRRGRRRRVLSAAAGATIAACAVVGVMLIGAGGHRPIATALAASQLTGLNLSSGTHEGAAVPLPGAPSAIAREGTSLWLADPDAGTVSRIDVATRAVVGRVPLGGNPGVLVTGGGSVWVAGRPGQSVTRIDAGTEGVTQTIRLGDASAAALAFGEGGLWVADTTDSSLIEFDPASGAARRTLPLDLRPTSLAIGAGAIWAADYDAGAVVQVDPRSGRMIARINVPKGPVALTVGAGSLWVASALESTVSRIDPGTGSIIRVIPVGSGPIALAVARGSIWVANQYSGTLSRIDTLRNEVVQTISLGGEPTTLTTAGRRLWVGIRPRARNRGGTLVLLRTMPLAIDPAVEAGISTFQNLGLTGDGLMAFNHVGGPAGLQLVPDLAISVPTPTDGGRTYTFRLRPGIRYSDGRPVQASDFRREIERVFRMRSLDRELMAVIVGAAACSRPAAKTCDISRGVVTDDAAHTVTFHLVGPDPGFLSNLTNGGVAMPVPPGTPRRGTGVKPIPGTGPYMIASADRHHIRYVRNPYFREWSHAARPAGSPDEIVWRFGLSPAQQVREIQQGRADWMADPVPAELLPGLRTRFAGQLHRFPWTDTEWLQFNTRRPPFDDVRVRQALSLAIDRDAIVRIWGGPDAAEPACQLLPPGIPGYQRYCPYTRHPAAGGAWTAPDPARARRLVTASGTRGAHVTVWGWSDDAFAPPSIVRHVASVLRSLGYRVDVRLVTHASLADPPASTFAAIQVIPTGWAGITAYDFFGTWMSCAGVGTHAWFCDRRMDREMRRARALESTRPRAAAALWKRIDREATDRAVFVPLVNPRETEFVSRRMENFQHHAYLGLIADQVWLR